MAAFTVNLSFARQSEILLYQALKESRHNTLKIQLQSLAEESSLLSALAVAALVL